jgi:hypothetical protein
MSEERKAINLHLPYVLRMTFGLVHAVLLSILSLAIILFIPSVSDWSFSWFGCLVCPVLSLGLTVGCTACVDYVSNGATDVRRLLRSAWIPPVGVFCISLLILPLQAMQSGRWGPLSVLIATSILANAIVVGILQHVAALPAAATASLPPQTSSVAISATSSGSPADSGPK